MSNVVAINAAAEAVIRARRGHYLWTAACGMQIDKRLGWAFPKGIPGDIGDAWHAFATMNANAPGCSGDGGALNWDTLFKAFTDRWLRYQSDYTLAIEVLDEEVQDPLGNHHGRNV